MTVGSGFSRTYLVDRLQGRFEVRALQIEKRLLRIVRRRKVREDCLQPEVRDYEPRLALDGPWPGADLAAEDLAARLAAHLWDPASQFFRNEPLVPPAQVCHLACHCDTSAELNE